MYVKRSLIFILTMTLLSACAPAKQITFISTSTLIPTNTPTQLPTSIFTSTSEPTATATEAATAAPEIQIAPDNESFLNYSISTDTIVNHTDDLVAKARDELIGVRMLPIQNM